MRGTATFIHYCGTRRGTVACDVQVDLGKEVTIYCGDCGNHYVVALDWAPPVADWNSIESRQRT